MALVVFALSSACLTPFNPTYKTTKLYPPVGWVERMPQKSVKSEKNKTFTRDAAPTGDRVKPNTEVGFHSVFGCIGRRVGFGGIRTPPSACLTPFNPTYKTTKLYPPVGWVERMPQKPVKSEKNKTFIRDATATRKPRETQHLYLTPFNPTYKTIGLCW